MRQDTPPIDDHDAEPPSPRPRPLRDWFAKEARWVDEFLQRWLTRLFFVTLHSMLILGSCYLMVWGLARSRCHDQLDEVPLRFCGVVLGCGKMSGPDENPFFQARVNAAAELFKEGKVQYLLVSGDPSKNGSNEPADMKSALIKLGVPAEHIYRDDAGFRTLDSVIRAKQIFGQVEFTIISQKFHNERAIYIARRHGIRDAVAYNAPDASFNWMLKAQAREVLARVMAILDVEVLKTEPAVLGERSRIGPMSPPTDAAR